MISFGSVRDVNEMEFDEVWYIVRSLKINLKESNAHWVPELSPSRELFYKYLDASKAGVYDNKWFSENYVPQFLHEMRNADSMRKLNELYKLGKSKNILCVCFCEDENLCHRSIVSGLLQGAYSAMDDAVFVESSIDRSFYYEMYKNA